MVLLFTSLISLNSLNHRVLDLHAVKFEATRVRQQHPSPCMLSEEFSSNKAKGIFATTRVPVKEENCKIRLAEY